MARQRRTNHAFAGESSDQFQEDGLADALDELSEKDEEKDRQRNRHPATLSVAMAVLWSTVECRTVNTTFGERVLQTWPGLFRTKPGLP